MIIGNGDIATAIRDGGLDRPDVTWFASGVSNSAEFREGEFRREADLLTIQPIGARLVYFSSLIAGATPYGRHKRQMEKTVRLLFPCWTIFRLGNITWGDNPHTFINHMRAVIQRGDQPDIWDVYRHVIDRGEFLQSISLLPPCNAEINLPGRRLKVADILSECAMEYA